MELSPESRWAGVGRSNAADSVDAGREAVRCALDDNVDPRLVIVFCSERHDLEALIGAINAESGGVPLIGCSTAGEIATDGPEDSSVVVFALGGSGFTVLTTAAEHVPDDLRSAGAQAASRIAELDDRRHRLLLMLPDALAGDQDEIIRGAYSVVGASVPLVGGCAGDDLKMEATYQFHGDRVLQNAVVTAAIASEGPIGIGVRHGWQPVGEAMLVTRSTGEIVHEIDGRPALDVYLERLDAPAEAYDDPAGFTRFALMHPIGLARRTSEPHVRFVGEADFTSRSLVCIASVPEGAAIRLMRGEADSVLAATDAACQDALDAVHPHQPVGILAFDCIARRAVLGGPGISREIDQIAALTNGAPVAGFYTYGEIARTRGINGFHNETLVVLAVA
jgi:hypothetical protein